MDFLGDVIGTVERKLFWKTVLVNNALNSFDVTVFASLATFPI